MAALQTCIDDELKAQPNALFKMTVTEAESTGKQPNTKTLEALKEVGGTSYKSVKELSKLWK